MAFYAVPAICTNAYLSAWKTNWSQSPSVWKQSINLLAVDDRECKTFGRPACKIKKPSSQLRLCMDALDVHGTVLTTCEKNRWKFFITFKQGSMPTLWTEYQSLLPLSRGNRKVIQIDKNTRQEFAWVQDMEHTDDHKRRHTFNIFPCREAFRRDHTQSCFVWLTNFPNRPNSGSSRQISRVAPARLNSRVIPF